MEILTKRFRLTYGSLFMRLGDKSKYVVMGENKMVCKVLQGIIPIDKLLTEVERDMLEAFKLTEIMKNPDEIYIYITKEDFQH